VGTRGDRLPSLCGPSRTFEGRPSEVFLLEAFVGRRRTVVGDDDDSEAAALGGGGVEGLRL
jgi:hypothetical protein